MGYRSATFVGHLWRRLLVVLALIAYASMADAETRVALVIGNANYANVPQLTNPTNDASLVASSLRQVGFQDVTKIDNLDRAGMMAALQSFGRKASKADVAMVYFAGHGLEMDGINYLVPVDARLARDTDVQYEAIPVNAALTSVSGAREMQIVVMDACRNNPFVVRMRSTGAHRTVTRGLAAIEPAGNTLVLFSAKDGTVAQDGVGPYSPFAEAFATDIVKPVEIDKFVRLVRDDVRSQTHGQTPWMYGTLSSTDFYFVAQSRDSRARSDVASGSVPAKAQPTIGSTLRDCTGACPEMMVVSPGSFVFRDVDSTLVPSTRGLFRPERLAERIISIGKVFAIGKYPVTIDEYRAFVEQTGWESSKNCFSETATGQSFNVVDSHGWQNPGFAQSGANPVVCVNWKDAQAYIQWLSTKTGNGYRLLSEAEYEYAARAGSKDEVAWGADPDNQCKVLNGADESMTRAFDSAAPWGAATCNDGFSHTSPVGSFPPNAFGLYDMNGNVWSWTQDCYAPGGTRMPSNGEAQEDGLCNGRILRGGAWTSPPGDLQYSKQNMLNSTQAYSDVGFRVARTL